jgi:hypothetical protein
MGPPADEANGNTAQVRRPLTPLNAAYLHVGPPHTSAMRLRVEWRVWGGEGGGRVGVGGWRGGGAGGGVAGCGQGVGRVWAAGAGGTCNAPCTANVGACWCPFAQPRQGND